MSIDGPWSYFGIFLDDHMVNEVRIVSDVEHSSEEESEDEETAGKVVTKAGVEVYKTNSYIGLTI